MAHGVLLAALSNPPLTSGDRTRARVELLADLLGFDDWKIGNLFAWPTRNFDDLRTAGEGLQGWLQARRDLEPLVDSAGAVLMAWGTRAPAGQAGVWFRDQVAWLDRRVQAAGVATFTVGESPRHPSRWQRWTAAQFPGDPFAEALIAACYWPDPSLAHPRRGR